MSAAPSLRVVRSATPQADLEALRSRLGRLQEPTRQPIATPDVVRPLIDLRTGSAYRVDDQSLALAMLSAVSGEGAWVGVIGVDDLGLEAAVEAGLDLTKVVIIPDPGDLWLEALTALVDVLPMVLLRPAREVNQRLAATVSARLRKRSATLVVQGSWPGAEARLWVERARWSGLGEGFGRLREREAQVGCRRGTSPAAFAAWPPRPASGVEGVVSKPRGLAV